MQFHFSQLSPFAFDLKADWSGYQKVVIFGSSGSGKSSLIHFLAGLKKTQPNHFIRFQDLTWQQDRYCLPTHKRSLACVFQRHHLISHWTIDKNLFFGLASKTHQPEFINELIEVFALSLLLKRHPDALSGGERQRVAIARALLQSPSCLLLDEPFIGIDRELKNNIHDFILRYLGNHQTQLILVSHHLEELYRYADYVAVMQQGRFIYQGKVGGKLFNQQLSLNDHEACSIFDLPVINKDGLCFALLGTIHIPLLKDQKSGAKVRIVILHAHMMLTISSIESSALVHFPVTISHIETDKSVSLLIENGMYEVEKFRLQGGAPLLRSDNKQYYLHISQIQSFPL